MAPKRLGNVTIEGARLIFRNFEGKKERYNPNGIRNFSVVLEPVVAQAMAEDGWNVKYLKPREEGEEPTPYIQVTMSWKNRPPRIVVITSRGRTNLEEEQVIVLDWAEFTNVDLIINPYSWEVDGNQGVKAYLHSLYVTILENPLELKYADVKEIEGTNMLQIEAGPDRLPVDPDEIVIEESDPY